MGDKNNAYRFLVGNDGDHLEDQGIGARNVDLNGHPIDLIGKIVLKERIGAQGFETNSGVSFKVGNFFTIRTVISF
jgi:hypothetical protein